MVLLSQFVEYGKHVVCQAHNFQSSNLWADAFKAIHVADHNRDTFKFLQIKIKR